MPPIAQPSSWNTRATLDDVAPIDFMIAISRVLSVTIIVSAEIMFTAATTMMSVRMMTSASFWRFSAVNRLWLSSYQSWT